MFQVDEDAELSGYLDKVASIDWKPSIARATPQLSESEIKLPLLFWQVLVWLGGLPFRDRGLTWQGSQQCMRSENKWSNSVGANRTLMSITPSRLLLRLVLIPRTKVVPHTSRKSKTHLRWASRASFIEMHFQHSTTGWEAGWKDFSLIQSVGQRSCWLADSRLCFFCCYSLSCIWTYLLFAVFRKLLLFLVNVYVNVNES